MYTGYWNKYMDRACHFDKMYRARRETAIYHKVEHDSEAINSVAIVCSWRNSFEPVVQEMTYHLVKSYWYAVAEILYNCNRPMTKNEVRGMIKTVKSTSNPGMWALFKAHRLIRVAGRKGNAELYELTQYGIDKFRSCIDNRDKLRKMLADRPKKYEKQFINKQLKEIKKFKAAVNAEINF